MQYPKLSDLRHTPRPELVIMPAPLPDVARQAATAHVRHGLVRSLQGFLDRAGCVELEHPAHFALAAHLRRACWSTRTGGIAGLIPGASDALLIDLLERGLLATLHGTLDRAATELQALGVDCDRLKYLRLPVRRLHADAGATVARDVWPGLLPDAESRILAETGEPLLMLAYTPDAGEDGPALRSARLLLPGVGCVAAAAPDRFSFDIAALLRFVCAAEAAVLARPTLA